MEKLKKYFMTGLIVLIPFFLTIYLFWVVFLFVDGILGNFLNTYIKSKLGFYLPGLGLILFVLLIIFSGFFASRFIGKKLLIILENWFAGLPLIKKIYPTVKQIILFILAQKEFGFKKVVLAEYPSKGIWSLGFLTNEGFKGLECLGAKEIVAVFVPSSPGPLTGYVIFVPKEEVKFVDMSVSDALKIIISGGVFKP